MNEEGNCWSLTVINREPEKEVVDEIKIKQALTNGDYKKFIQTGDSPEVYNGTESTTWLCTREKNVLFERC